MSFMSNYISALDNDVRWFEDVKKYTEKLLRECYDFKRDQSLDQGVVKFFDQQ